MPSMHNTQSLGSTWSPGDRGDPLAKDQPPNTERFRKLLRWSRWIAWTFVGSIAFSIMFSGFVFSIYVDPGLFTNVKTLVSLTATNAFSLVYFVSVQTILTGRIHNGRSERLSRVHCMILSMVDSAALLGMTLGEHPLLVCFRVVVLLAFSYVILILGTYAIIVQPAGLSSSENPISVKEYRENQMDEPFFQTAYIRFSSPQSSADTVSQAVNFTTVPIGDHRDKRETTVNDISIGCTVPVHYPIPDTLITVDFAVLNTSTTSNSSNYLTESALPLTAYVFIGAGDIPADVFRDNALPFPLTPGAHYHAYVVQEVREMFYNPEIALWGVWTQSSIRYVIGKIFIFFPDPSTEASSNSTASLRLTFVHGSIVSGLSITSDYQDKTVVKGLATLGGLATSLSAIFAFLFDGSLLYHLIGSKPFGVFGVLHAFQKKRLVEANSIPYPSTPLERFLARFFVDFAEGSHKSDATVPDTHDTLNNTSNPHASGSRDNSDTTLCMNGDRGGHFHRLPQRGRERGHNENSDISDLSKAEDNTLIITEDVIRMTPLSYTPHL